MDTQDKERGPLDSLAEVLKDERKDDIEARESAGFDRIWAKCEDNYSGVDEMNLAEALYRPRYTKPMDVNGPLLLDDTAAKKNKYRSTAFLRQTARYVDAGKAKVVEVVLPAKDKSYEIKATPIPTLVLAKENLEPMQFPAGHPAAGQPMLRDPKPEELAPPNPADPLLPPTPDPTQPPSQMPGVPVTPKDLATEKEETAEKKAKKAEKQIEDWFVEGKYRKKMRRVIFSMAKLGVGILKAPTPEMRKSTAVQKEPVTDDQGQPVTDAQGQPTFRVLIERLEEVKPGFQVISPWDFYPDKDCGDDIHNGSHVWERARLSERKLKALKDLPGYIPKAIEQVVEEGPEKTKQGKPKDQHKKDGRYELWHRTGTISKDQAEAFNSVINTGKDDILALPIDKDQLSVTITMVNDTLIRCVKHTLETGDFNYHAIPWQERDESWIGIGVAEQLFMPQALIVATLRSMINNAGNSSGPQIVINRSIISAHDGEDAITPWKLWEMQEAAAVDDIRKAFGIFPIPSEIKNLMELAEFAMRLAEESTSIPLITQGQSGDTTPDTLGGMQLQNNNANQLLRDVANHVDDYGTEPIVTQFHEHMLLDPDVDQDCKGDHQIDAHGSIVLVERYIQNQFIASLGAVVKDPAFGINPKKWVKELMMANYYDPTKIQYTEAEQQKLASVPPPEDPKIAVAKIQAQVGMQKTQMELTGDAQSQQADNAAAMQLEMLKYANQHRITIEEIKAKLSSDVMKLRVQQQLSMAEHREQRTDRAAEGQQQEADRQHAGLEKAKDRAADGYERHQDRAAAQVLTPPTEPAGRAPNGEAFQK